MSNARSFCISTMRSASAIVTFLFCLLTINGAFAASEIEENEKVTAAVQDAFLKDRFAELNEVSRSYRVKKSRTPSGLWLLTWFYSGIGSAMVAQTEGREREPAYRELERRTMRWAEKYPDSPTAHIAHSMALIDHAWAYRGERYATAVKPEAWAPFRRYISLARENLEKHKAVAAVDPAWYETMLTIARAENWEREQFESLLTEALSREPLFYQTYFLALEYLLPKWHGSTKEIEEFAQSAVKKTVKDEGRGMYARIYWFASQTEFKNELFTGSFANWPRMKDSFDDIVVKYPDAWNLNNYAKFACLAKDKTQTRNLLKRIGSATIPEAWSPEPLLDQCVVWAKLP